jgi:hypothetical protein
MKIDFDIDDLRPIIERTVSETIAQLDAERRKVNGRLGYTEPEAAAALGIQRHALRDARLRGEIAASKIGKRIVYSPGDLVALLVANRIG